MLLRACSLLVLLCFAAACGGDACPRAKTCDIRQTFCQRRAIKIAACLRGDDPGVDVDVAVIDAESFIEQAVAQQAEADVEPISEEEKRFRAALALYGLSSEAPTGETDLRRQLEQVAAFYSDGQVVVLDRGTPLDSPELMSTLVHEAVHALQDARGDFGSFARAVSFDQWLARRAMIEGEATFVDYQAYAEMEGIVDIDWRETFENFQARMLERARESTDPFVDAFLLFPYAWGGAYVHGAATSLGDIAPLFDEAAPSSTRQVMAGFGALPPDGGAWLEELGADAVPVLDALSPEAVTSLGRWFTDRWLERQAQTISGVGEHLRADAFTVLSQADVPIGVWRMRLETSAQAERIRGELMAVLSEGVSVFAEGSDIFLVRVESGSVPEPSGFVAQTQFDFVVGEPSMARWAAPFGCGLSRALSEGRRHDLARPAGRP